MTDVPYFQRQDDKLSSLMGSVFKYDQLNRLVAAMNSTTYTTASVWTQAAANKDFSSTYKYDDNGNILGLTRFSAGTTK